MWACRFGKHSKCSMIRCRKCNFVLIDVEVGILLTFLESTKAKVRLYQKYVFVLPCLHMKSWRFSGIRFRSFHFGLRIHSLRFHRAFSPFRCKREAKTERKVCVFNISITLFTQLSCYIQATAHSPGSTVRVE